MVLSLYLGKLDLLVFHAQDLVNGPQAENSVLEKTFGWSFVQVLAMKEIIIDHFSREGLRALLVVQAQVRQALSEQGYIDARVSVEEEYSEDRTLVRLNVLAEEGEGDTGAPRCRYAQVSHWNAASA